jgi:hypothetical protein
MRSGMELPVKRFHEDLAACLSFGNEFPRLDCVGGEGFLEKDVFTCFKGFARPFEVEPVRKRNVDEVYLGVIKKFFVGPIRLLKTMLASNGFRTRVVA